MGIFGGGKKKKSDGEPIPETSEFPLKAYVYRLLPEKVGKVQVAGRVPGDFDGWVAAQDLEDMVAKLCGGGTYRCKCVKSGETKTHIGYHTFTIPGSPLLDGQSIDPERENAGKPREPNKVAKIEQEIEEEEAQGKLDEARAVRRAKQRQLGLLKDDDEDNEDENAAPTFGMPGFETPEMAQIRASMKMLEKRLEDKDREMERRAHENEVRAIREEMERKIDAIASKPSGDGGIGVMLSSQMEAIKAMMSSSQAQTNAMLQSNSEMIKMIMGRDPSTGINERVDRLVEKLLDAKSSTGKEVMEAMKDSFQTGILMARGGEPAPTSMADVARDFSGRVLDIVGEFARQKGAMTKETLQQEIQKATARVVSGLKASALPQIGRARALPPGGIPAGDAMPAIASQGQPLSREDLRTRVDQVMDAFLNDIEHGTEEWKAVAQAQIPAVELRRIGEFTFDNVAQYCMMHGSPVLVKRVMQKLLAMGAVTVDQANMLLASYHIAERVTAPAGQPAGVPSESDEEATADDDADDALMGGDDDGQGGDDDGQGGDDDGQGESAEPAEPTEPARGPMSVVPNGAEKPKRRRK